MRYNKLVSNATQGEMQMLANKQFVKNTMYSMNPAHFKSSSWERLYWCDKAVDSTRRNLAFKFGSTEQAEVAAQMLRGVLETNGYENTVRVTQVGRDTPRGWRGGNYVRVQVLNV